MRQKQWKVWVGCLWCLLMLSAIPSHPIFVSVTEITHNSKEQTLEISCKIFTDDFEQALRSIYKEKIDLLNPALKEHMQPLVSRYVQQHLQIAVNGKPVQMSFLGYEQAEEGIETYWEVKQIPAVKSMDVTNNILYEQKPQQIEIIHVIVEGKRQSTKLNNPDSKAEFRF